MSAYVTFLTWPKLALLVVALSAAYSSVQCCSPIDGPREEISMTYKAQQSDIILTAIVQKTYPDGRFSGHNVYYADLEVKCLYKGPQLEAYIRVAEAGQVPGLCFTTNLTESSSYVLYLRRDGDQFKQDFPADPDEEQFLDEITAVCGVYLHFPRGYNNENKKHYCSGSEESIEGDCIGTTTLQPVLDQDKSEEKAEEEKAEEEKTETKPEQSPENEAKYNNVRSDPGNSGQTLCLCWSFIISLISAMFVF
ncbi:unnamed protein product [Lymnaea stagnalis]|uniref:Uncharacterized protein n=1 Tax=Lymnaea stagnalis TaxID=6523 RepID=A0AAV2I0Y0_LYMST